MKRTLVLAAFAATLGLAGFAVAQTPPAPPPPAADARPDMPPPGPPGGPRMMMRDHGPMHPPQLRGARFHINRGDARIDVRCAENETMRACVDAASALLDKLPAQAR